MENVDKFNNSWSPFKIFLLKFLYVSPYLWNFSLCYPSLSKKCQSYAIRIWHNIWLVNISAYVLVKNYACTHYHNYGKKTWVIKNLGGKRPWQIWPWQIEINSPKFFCQYLFTLMNRNMWSCKFDTYINISKCPWSKALAFEWLLTCYHRSMAGL